VCHNRFVGREGHSAISWGEGASQIDATGALRRWTWCIPTNIAMANARLNFSSRPQRQAPPPWPRLLTYVTLAEVRQYGFELRRLLAAGGDPLEAKRAAKREQLLATTRGRTFKDVALEYIAAHESGWRGNHSRQQSASSLRRYAFPKIGDLAIADIDVAAVLAVLTPIWSEIPETASRVRHRIALILDYAAARELRPHDNPARRRKLLPDHKKAVRNFAAMPYAQLPECITKLRDVTENIPAPAGRQPQVGLREAGIMHLVDAQGRINDVAVRPVV
jgi:hypothetical protein